MNISCPCVQDLCRFYGFVLCIQVCLFLITAVPYLHHHKRPAAEVAINILATIVASVPIGGPTVIIAANWACALKLKAKGINVLISAKLRSAADVSIACFDKTGTLTGSIVSSLLLLLCCCC